MFLKVKPLPKMYVARRFDVSKETVQNMSKNLVKRFIY
jgi:hypothetical protein